jgi:hypothetical protein
MHLGLAVAIELGLLGGTLSRHELFALQHLAAAAITKLDELPRQLLVLEIEQIRLGDLRVEIVLVRRKVGGLRFAAVDIVTPVVVTQLRSCCARCRCCHSRRRCRHGGPMRANSNTHSCRLPLPW